MIVIDFFFKQWHVTDSHRFMQAADRPDLLFCCLFSAMGSSRKYPYTMTDGFLEFRGQGGFFELEFQRHGGILTIGIPKA